MSLFKEIKNDHLKARIVKEETRKNLLSTLIGDLNKNQICQDGIKIDPTNEEVTTIIIKFIKTAKDAIRLITKASDYDIPSVNKIDEEIKILEEYLPKQLSLDDLKKEIHFAAISRGYVIGPIMQYLKSKYFGRYDGKIASTLINELRQYNEKSN